ncbi:MAG TPA: amino acid permease [Dehalococcoidia bacterium]|nr:amino acid permease [Dehalococcoidia bacterium]
MTETAASGPFRRELGLPDFTLLVIGAIIGDGVYVVGAMGARLLGPAQVVAWLLAGVLAALIALAFVQCAAIKSEVGGSYSYAHASFGPLAGFLTGWALYAGEWVALSAFPLAFVNYLQALTVDLPQPAVVALRLGLIGAVTSVNLIGVRKGARTNDVLTVAKLVPLAFLIVLAVVLVFAKPGHAGDNLSPFAPLGWSGLGQAVLPIFWAFAGFELAVLPAAEVRSPRRSLPLGLAIGVTVATVFYLLTVLAVVMGLPWQETANSAHPLAAVMGGICNSLGLPTGLGVRFMSAGALISIAGVFVVFMLSLSRLSYALAADGFFPPPFARLHPRFGTPYVGLAFQAGSAVVLSTMFDIRGLLSTAVFFLSFCYLMTALSALRLVSRQPEFALHVPALRPLLVLAAASAIYLTLQATSTQMLIGAGVLAVGLLIYGIRRLTWVGPSDQGADRSHHDGTLDHLHSWLLHALTHRHKSRR